MVQLIEGIPIMRPYIDQDNQAYWDAVKQHKLVVQHCRACDLTSSATTDVPILPFTGHSGMEAVLRQGKAIFFCKLHHRSMAYPAFKLPYAVVLVELEEGVRLTANTHEIHPNEIFIGMPVEIMFEDLEDDLTLYRFKKRAG